MATIEIEFEEMPPDAVVHRLMQRGWQVFAWRNTAMATIEWEDGPPIPEDLVSQDLDGYDGPYTWSNPYPENEHVDGGDGPDD